MNQLEKTKKILSLLIIIAVIFQVSVFAENTSSKRANLKSTEKELAQNVISNLEIMDYSEDNESDVISRIDFAVYFGRLLQVDEYSKQNITYYKDVPDDHYALACLNYITQMGGFDGTGDTEFCPNDPISPIQAAKVIFNVLGYRTYANALGGYPLAYLNLSKDTGLLDGFDGCNDITRNEMMVLLFRAGFIDKMEVANFKNESLEFNNKNSGSLFEENWDVYDYSGVLKNSGVITLDESIKTSDGRTVFDNVSYKITVSIPKNISAATLD